MDFLCLSLSVRLAWLLALICLLLFERQLSCEVRQDACDLRDVLPLQLVGHSVGVGQCGEKILRAFRKFVMALVVVFE